MSEQLEPLQWHNAQRRVRDLIPLSYNPRILDDDGRARLTRSIEKFNLAEVPAINTDHIVVAGHQRLAVLFDLGRGDELIDVRMPNRPLTKDELDEYNVTSNVSAGRFDYQGLLDNFSHLQLDTILDMPVLENLVKFSALNVLPAEEQEFDPTPPAEPVSALGDVYELNHHRIQCGDSCDADVVARTLQGAQPRLMLTDPPYGVVYDADWRNSAKRADGTRIGGFATGKVVNDDQADWTAAWALSPATVAYVYHAGLFAGVVATSLQNCGFELRSQLIWAKNTFAISRGHYHWQHEPCWYAVRKGHSAHFIGDRSNTTLWQIHKPLRSESGHSTQKPVECMSRPLLNHEGDVYDPFLGSGTTLLACELNGRVCYGQELNPAYVDVIVRRYVQFMRDNQRRFTITRNGEELTHEQLAAYAPAS